MAGATNWRDYERGRSDSMSSNLSRVHFEEHSQARETDRLLRSEAAPRSSGSHERPQHDLRRRRSSIAMAVGSLAQAGGVNSIENFARSWQRAAAFHEITPSRGSFQYADESSPDLFPQRLPVDVPGPQHHRSLLRQEIEAGRSVPETAAEDPESTGPALTRKISSNSQAQRKTSHQGATDIFAHASHLATPFSSSFSGSYGSLADRVNQTSRTHAARLYEEQQVTGTQDPDKETEPLLVRAVEQDDGKIVVEVVGQSTIYQTILNSINVLIGVGLLSLPLAIRYAGWLIGVGFLTFSYMSTGYTANLLGKCLAKNPGLITFVDLAYVAFGPRARVIIGVLFNLELLAAGVALFVLFADSLNILFDAVGLLELKLLCGVIMIPLSFVPFRFLGYTSLLGIICCMLIVLLVIASGIAKPHSPGSLIEPATTYLFPTSWMTLPLSFGLLMSPWGGHSVFPSIMRDMRHPEKYTKSLYITFNFTFFTDLCMGVVGLLMFGDDVLDEVTTNILSSKGYSRAIKAILLVCIAIIPLTKLPLNLRPIFSTFEGIFGLGPREISEIPGVPGMSGFGRGLFRAAIRVVVVIVVMIISIAVPSFDRVMALLGSAFCFNICIILPCCFYLRLIDNISVREKCVIAFLIVSCAVMGIMGTVWAFLPAAVTGGRPV